LRGVLHAFSSTYGSLFRRCILRQSRSSNNMTVASPLPLSAALSFVASMPSCWALPHVCLQLIRPHVSLGSCVCPPLLPHGLGSSHLSPHYLQWGKTFLSPVPLVSSPGGGFGDSRPFFDVFNATALLLPLLYVPQPFFHVPTYATYSYQWPASSFLFFFWR